VTSQNLFFAAVRRRPSRYQTQVSSIKDILLPKPIIIIPEQLIDDVAFHLRLVGEVAVEIGAGKDVFLHGLDRHLLEGDLGILPAGIGFGMLVLIALRHLLGQVLKNIARYFVVAETHGTLVKMY